MPQVLFLAAVAAGLLVARRWYTKERMRIAAELKRAKEAMERRDADSIVGFGARPFERHLPAKTRLNPISVP